MTDLPTELATELTASTDSVLDAANSSDQSEQRSVAELSPSRSIVQSTLALLNEADLAQVLNNQGTMLARFEKTNEMLRTVLQLSAHRYEEMGAEFRAHTQALASMKRDLDMIFRRIRNLKTVIAKQMPHEYASASVARMGIEEETEEAPEDTFSLSALPTDGAPGTQAEFRGRAKSQS